MTEQAPPDGELDSLLTYVHEHRNFDFRGYKRASLTRRISRRMRDVGVEDYQAYMDVLEANPGEFAELFNTILINVTGFLRDRDAWDVLAERILPSILHSKATNEPVRVWSAGCASGEEAYSLAVLLAEAVGEERFRHEVKIYATDADTDALVQARQSRYPEKALVEAFGEQRTRRFFELEEGTGTFRSDLRRSLIFGRHDLVLDPPISKVDLLACRNTLMYFTSDVQRQILGNFHFALNSGGFLFLGKSEALVTRLHLFEPTEVRQHIFRKDGERVDAGPISLPTTARTRASSGSSAERIAGKLLEQSPIAQLVLDADALVLVANLAARKLLSIGSSDIGAPLKSGVLSMDLSELRRTVEQVQHERRAISVPDVVVQRRQSANSSYDVLLTPMEGEAGVAVAFLDVSPYQALRRDLERSQRELESAYEELQSTVEELETTNEELQSTNEELETTNEELHSTNEELETMNEELQSANEELETINAELRVRNSQIDELNIFLQSILASMSSAVIVLGTEMEIRAWNRQAEDLWGLRADEVQGQHFMNLDIGFPVEMLGHAIRACLSGRTEGAQVRQEAVNRRGRAVECAVTISRLLAEEVPRGVILLMDAGPLGQTQGSRRAGGVDAAGDGHPPPGRDDAREGSDSDGDGRRSTGAGETTEKPTET